MMIEIVTLACAGDCADVEAVASGGNPPYAFEWEDGSTKPTRHVCLDADAELSVSATDTAIVANEFGYAAHTVDARVTATVLDCSDAGTTDGREDACGAGFKPGVYEGSFMQALGPLSGTHELVLMKSADTATQETVSGHLDNVLGADGIAAMVTWVEGSSFDCTTQRLFLSGVRSEATAFVPLPYTYEATYDPADDTLRGTWASAAPPSPGVYPTDALDNGTWDAHWVRP